MKPHLRTWLPLAACTIAIATVRAGGGSRNADGPPRLGGYVREIVDLREPSSAAIAADGTLYVVESLADRVQVFDAAGKKLFAFGEAGSRAGELLDPQGIAIASDGEVYVSDTENDRVQVFDRQGKALRRIGQRGDGPGELRRPLGIALDALRLYVADSFNHRIQVFGRDGRFVASFGRFGREPGELNHPADVAVDAAGFLYVADRDNQRVQKLDAQGKSVALWGDFGPYPELFSAPSGIEVAGDLVFVADRDNQRIEVYDRSGKRLYGFGVHALRPHEGRGRMHYPCQVAVAPSGQSAVVVEGFENRCQVFGPETPESLELQSSQEQMAAAHFGSGLDCKGRLLAVAEPSTPGVLVYDATQSEPIELTRFGAFGPGFGQFVDPCDVELDLSGERAWVGDPGAYRIDLVDLSRPRDAPLQYEPTLARFVKALDVRALHARGEDRGSIWPIEPAGLHIDARGELFVVDSANARVAVFDGDLSCVRAIGKHGAGTGELFLPTDVAHDRSGETLYVVDALACRVQAFDSHGRPQFAFGRKGTGPGAFTRPFGIAGGRDGFLYITDPGAHRVLKFDEKGTFIAAFGGPGLGRVEFFKPMGIAQDAEARIFVLDYGNHRGQILTGEGAFVVAFGSRLFTQPTRPGR
jgi:DNA-binding beta-propeller fold protein YncE